MFRGAVYCRVGVDTVVFERTLNTTGMFRGVVYRRVGVDTVVFERTLNTTELQYILNLLYRIAIA